MIKQFERADISCPECGPMDEPVGTPSPLPVPRGHSFTDRELLIPLSETMQIAFWTSLSIMEERRSLLLKLHKKDKERGYESVARRHVKRAEEMELHMNNLKKLLFSVTRVD